MRVAFVATWNAFLNDGVLRKMEGQCRAWRELGHEVKLFILTSPPDSGADAYQGDAELFYSGWTASLPPRARKFVSRIASVPELQASLHSFGPDVIYYRMATWFPGLVRALTRIGPYIVEVNTKDLNEVKRSRWSSRTFYLATRGFTLGKASGFVAVSQEISEMLAEEGKPTLVLGNGFPVRTVRPRLPPQNQRPCLVFAGTPGQLWHGVDKIIHMAKLLPEADFHIVGPDRVGVPESNLFFHGFLSKSKLFELYQRMDIGVGSLALHRNDMSEASPLKVREYVSVGLPVIVGYRDTDLENCQFVLNIGNYENNVSEHLEKIRDFIIRWKDIPLDREEVAAKIGDLKKEKRRLDFFKRIFDRGSTGLSLP